MADKNGTPQLKRKREGAESQRKKVKTGKSKPVANGDPEAGTPLESKNDTPELKSAPKSAVTPQSNSKQKSHSTPQNSQANGTPANPATSTLLSSQKKKDKSNSKAQKIVETDVPAVETPAKQDDGPSTSISTKATAETQVSIAWKEKEHKKKDKVSDPWSVSTPQGGWFLPQDPVFSPDEKYLLLGKLKALDVYATDTSLRTRTLQLSSSNVALAYALSSTNSNLVYVADSAGTISLWDWTEASRLGRWDIGANVQHLAVVEQPSMSRDLVFTHEPGTKHVVNVHALYIGDEASKTELKQILKTTRPITEMQVLLQGKLVVVSTPNSLIIGKRRRFKQTTLQDFEYTWREFEMSRSITSFNAFAQIESKGGQSKALDDTRDHLDLAVGDEEGAIHLFEDVISKFVAAEKSQKESSNKKVGPESLAPRRLHWHRSAVRSLKWSLDGNYLISGGSETVLTLWQLSTGKTQHLPHLTAAVENIVVSPSGASYALSLANNSVIVLSTSELKAKTNIVGIQTRRISTGKLQRLSDPNIPLGYLNPVPLDVDPKNSNHIAFVTPSSQPRHEDANIAEPYLQTFDIADQRPVSRQALTRNNATDPNMGPDGRPILEPGVKLLRISHNGEWLATVDEWIPPAKDLAFIEEGIPAFNAEERTLRREVYLKIWRRDEENAQWVLDARIDAPHFIEGTSAHARVFDLVADPSGTGFATVGEDRVVRIWRPKTRMHDGMVVRGADQKHGLVNWTLVRSTKLPDKLDVVESNETVQEIGLRTSQLAFSDDGSVLAAGVSWALGEDSGVVHIIDTESGCIQRSITETDVTSLSGLAILERYLIVIGSAVVVWDMVMDQLVYSIPNQTPRIKLATHNQLLRLATNAEDGTFAVSTPRLSKKAPEDGRFTKVSTKVTVFSPNSSQPLWHCTISDAAILGLVPTKGARGFIALDTSSNIRLISPSVATLQLPSPPPESTSDVDTDDVEVDDEDVEDGSEEKSALQLDASERLLHASDNDKPVVRPEQLQQIFDSGSSHALPPVRDLFNAVVGLYGRKPRSLAAGAA